MIMTTAQLRTLKGCPISVLWALLIARQDGLGPVGAEWIERSTGYSDKTVDNSLKFLNDNQYITHNSRYGWQLASGVMQLPLMMPELEAGNDPRPPSTQPVDKSVDNSEIDSENFRLGEFPSPVSSSSSGLTKLDSRLDPPPTTRPGDPENFRVEQNLAECDAQGIREPKRSLLAKMPHVTPELIRHHCQTCQNIGLAIYRIEHNFKIPSLATGGRPYLIPDPPLCEETPVDEQAGAWWGELVERLRDHVPKADFDTYIGVQREARLTGSLIEVRIANRMIEDILQKYRTHRELDRLISEISGGAATEIKFVTHWNEEI